MPKGTAPLLGLRVLDHTHASLGAIGGLLAELGAEVLRAAPDPDQATPIEAALAARGKLNLTGAIAPGQDYALLRALAARADVLIEATPPGSPAARALDAAGLAAAHPGLIVLSVSPFGADGPCAAWQATEPVLYALGGVLSRSGLPGRPPLLPPPGLALHCAMLQAVYAVLRACYARLATGRGAHLDCALLDAARAALDPGYGIAGTAALGVPASELPRGRVDARAQYPIIACADGHVRLCVLAPRQWRNLHAWMGSPPEYADPSYDRLDVRFADPTLVPAIARFLGGKTRAVIEAEAQAAGVPAAALLSLAEALAAPQLAARHALTDLALPGGAAARAPNGLIEIDGVRCTPPRTEFCTPAEALARWDQRPAPAPALDDELPPGPLGGLRVLDFGVIVVGGEQARLLADDGADVIKIESAAFPDGTRQNRAPGAPISPAFAAGHFNKRSLGINLRDPAGRALVAGLAARADVMMSNFKPGTLASLGLDDATLRQHNERLITVESAAFGATGPWSGRMGYGPLVRAASGLTALWRDPAIADGFADTTTIYPDHAAGRAGAIAALALLIRRARTGTGGAAAIAQNEVILNHIAQRIAANGNEPDAPPNAPFGVFACAGEDAPFGVFACAGEDEWCVVTVRDDADFAAICRCIARPDLAADPALAACAGRRAQRARLEAALAAWLASRTPDQAMTALQHHKAPAGAMLRVADLPEFAHFAARAAYRRVRHPHLPGEFWREADPVRSPGAVARDAPAPLLGEHSVAIARAEFGLDDASIAALIERGVLEIPAPAPGATTKAPP